MSSRIPVPRSVKRDAPEPIFNHSRDESPSQQKAARLAGTARSPTRRLPDMSSPPSGLVRRMSLAPSTRSPLATPPRRHGPGSGEEGARGNNGGIDRVSAPTTRLSVYGVPMAMGGGGRAGGATNHHRRLTIGPGDAGSSKRIIVCVRKRPLAASEERQGDDCVQADMQTNSITITVARTKLDGLGRYGEEFGFAYDRVFDAHCTNALIYRQIVAPLVDFALGGGKATIFAYGQTGSGKTHTMFRTVDGLCYQAALDLLGRCGALRCHVSFFEIYQSQLYDLLQARRRVVPCERRDGQVAIMGLCEEIATSGEEARELIQRGLAARMTGKTGANSQSSRSHAILHLTLKALGAPGEAATSTIFGRLSFIDLAGSERGADRAETDQQTRREGSEINKSLLALKECIRALDMDASHLPFRQSKLTLVLKDSIVGSNVRTAMIATVSPATGSSEHTLNTLRYAERFHEISGAPLGEIENMEPVHDNAQPGSHHDETAEEPKHQRSLPPLCDWTVSPITRIGGSDGNSRGGSAKVTPVRTVTFATPDSSHSRIARPAREAADAPLVQHRRQIAETLGQLQQRVEACTDSDVLELLKEELQTLSQAFKSLA